MEARVNSKTKADLFANFRVNIQLLRINQGYSTKELAEQIGINAKRITDLEYGKYGRGVPKAEELFRFSKFFNVSAEDLVHKSATIKFE